MHGGGLEGDDEGMCSESYMPTCSVSEERCSRSFSRPTAELAGVLATWEVFVYRHTDRHPCPRLSRYQAMQTHVDDWTNRHQNVERFDIW